MTADIELTTEEYHRLTRDRLAIPVPRAVFRLTGPGTVDCVQGVLTNDIAAAGDHGLVWGAVLTPKGMIVADLWARRRAAEVMLVAPIESRQSLAQLWGRSFPPRLTRATDVTDSVAVRWLTGGAPEAVAGGDIAPATGAAPFSALLLADDADAADASLAAAGWAPAPAGWGRALELLGGWPTLGREIDARTLPQEVRFDDLGGVSYHKGCYTGQETVARLHFRGHANRSLRGLRLDGGVPEQREVVRDGRSVGTIGTVGRIGGAVVALAVLRREVETGDAVTAGGIAATVVALPFDAGLFG